MTNKATREDEGREASADRGANERPPEAERPVAFWELAPAIEFICWVVVALAPMLYLVNGPPVTEDQAVVQLTLVTLAVTGAIGLRIYNWRSADRWNAKPADEPIADHDR